MIAEHYYVLLGLLARFDLFTVSESNRMFKAIIIVSALECMVVFAAYTWIEMSWGALPFSLAWAVPGALASVFGNLAIVRGRGWKMFRARFEGYPNERQSGMKARAVAGFVTAVLFIVITGYVRRGGW
jgi:hypothetical protein